MTGKLEETLIHLCRLYGITPTQKSLLTRCVKCNGRILKVSARQAYALAVQIVSNKHWRTASDHFALITC